LGFVRTLLTSHRSPLDAAYEDYGDEVFQGPMAGPSFSTT
jgi:hypothetical protein